MDTKEKNKADSRQRAPQRERRDGSEKEGRRPQRDPRPSEGRQTRQRPESGQAAPAGAQQRRRQRPETDQAARPARKPEASEQSGKARAQKAGAVRTRQPSPEDKPQRKKAPAAQRSGASRRRDVPRDVPDKKRAYGNSKPKKKSAIASLVETIKTQQRRAEARKAAAAEKGKRKRKTAPTPAVIYTQPQPFNRDRFLLQLMTVTAVVLAMVLGLSVFFKVEVITVSGAETYSAWAVREASGINEGDNLLTFSKTKAAGKIVANLPYVEKVRIGIKLPNTVNIMITEESVVYAIKSADGTWWLMDSDGRVIEQSNNAAAAKCTQILGVTLDNPVVNERAIAAEAVPVETDPTGVSELAPVTTTGAQRLGAALQILKALEENDIVGDAASVDVTLTEEIILWYGNQYQVNLGDTSQLEYKIACMNDVILQMSDYQSGILDISFTIWPDQVVYTPFE